MQILCPCPPYLESIPNRNSRPAILLRESRPREREDQAPHAGQSVAVATLPGRGHPAGAQGMPGCRRSGRGFRHPPGPGPWPCLRRAGLVPSAGIALDPAPPRQPRAGSRPGCHRPADSRSHVQAGDGTPAVTRDGHFQPRHRSRPGSGQRQRDARDARLAARSPALDRTEPGEPASSRTDADSVRRQFQLLRGARGPLAKFGHNRDGKKKGEKQITFGLLCAGDGCPVAVEVFAGNTSDPATVSG